MRAPHHLKVDAWQAPGAHVDIRDRPESESRVTLEACDGDETTWAMQHLAVMLQWQHDLCCREMFGLRAGAVPVTRTRGAAARAVSGQGVPDPLEQPGSAQCVGDVGADDLRQGGQALSPAQRVEAWAGP